MLDEEASRKRIATHLEFLGYACEVQKDGWLYASHPVRWNFFVRPMPVGTLFHCTIHLGMVSEEKRAAFIEFFNRINSSTFFTRFTLERDEANGIFVMRARTLAPGAYRRREFGTFVDMWHKDLERLHEGPSLEPEEENEEKEDESKEQLVVN